LFQAGNVVAVLGLALLVGGMVFFGVIMAPLVFTKLPLEASGPFIRAAFPWYYAFVTVAAVVSAAGLVLRGAPGSAAALILVAAVTVWLWFWWLPHLEAMRLAGDTVGFGRGHRFSVWVNGGELVVGVVVLVRVAAD
jgi:hypothetical protein